MICKTIYLGGLGAETTVDEIRRAMDEYGAVEDLAVPPAQGFRIGFCRFAEYASAAKAIAESGRTIGTARVTIRAAIPKQSNTLFIYNVDFDATEGELLAALEPYGHVVYCTIPLDDIGRPRGYAFAAYEHLEQAIDALNGLGGIVLRGRELGARMAGVRQRDRKLPDDRMAVPGRPRSDLGG